MKKILYDYIEGISNGTIPSGLEMRQAVSRFIKDLERDDLYFDEWKANRAIKFISHLKHFSSSHAGKPFLLAPWQVFIVSNIFGWINKKTGLRRFRDIYIEIAKKNGKSPLASAIGLYMLVADGEADAMVVLAANSTEQAKTCLKFDTEFAKSIDPKNRKIRLYRNELRFGINTLKVVSSDSSKLDGMNISCAIVDEYHEAKTSLVYDNLKSSQASREEPLFIVITTAGFDKKSPCYTLRKGVKEVLSSEKTDDTQFVAIFTMDEGDDYTDEYNWQKSNPNLFVTVKYDFLKSEVIKSINNVSMETSIKTKHFNIWCDTLTTWISRNHINSSFSDLTFDDIPEDVELLCSVDLATVSDICAVTYMWVVDGEFYFINKYYLPEDSMNSKQDKLWYNEQHKDGSLILVEGNVIDHIRDILYDIVEVNNKHYIKKIIYDDWNANQFVVEASLRGFMTENYRQGFQGFNRPTREMERLVLKNIIYIGKNELTRWMFSNVLIVYDRNGNVRPDKSNPANKIDGVISMLMCLGYWLDNPVTEVKVY